jgi:hypothetical protein
VIVEVGTNGFSGTQMLCSQTAVQGYRPMQSALVLQPTLTRGGGRGVVVVVVVTVDCLTQMLWTQIAWNG